MKGIKQILNENYALALKEDISDEKHSVLKSKLLEMSIEISQICEANNISIFLVGGSLLGAVRHNGFIPWDDDIDFGMLREDYEKFKMIFNDCLSEKYSISVPNYSSSCGNRFMKIFMKGTVLKTMDSNPNIEPEQISIDIFPYDYVPNYPINYIKGYICNIYMLIASAVTRYKYPNSAEVDCLNKSLQGKIINHLYNVIGFLFSYKEYSSWLNIVDNLIKGNKSSYITSATGRNHYIREIFKYDDFFPLTKLKFENTEFFAPRNYKKYLTKNYTSNFMELPPVECRESHFIKEIKV